MKRLLMALTALFMISYAADAQTAPPPAGTRHQPGEIRRNPGKNQRHRKIRRFHRRHRRRAVTEQLHFSDQQNAQAKVYRQDFRSKMKALNNKEDITVKEQRDERAALLKEQKSKMQSLLTADQKKNLAAMQANRKAKMERHYQTHLNTMKAKLDLSDQQVTALQSQRTAMMEKAKAIKENDQLNRHAKKEQLMALKNDMKASREKIFSEDQLKKIEAIKQAHTQKEAVK
ncbi:MAG: hypothetical protein JST86_17935 [Bacteroidetes bacterium]|nr:hypothetical protein [Bacteroidota bacterium]